MYHRGFLMLDRQVATSDPPYGAIAKAMWQVMERGNVCLVQRKVEEGCYEYIAIKR